jgi:hypothetical protein
MGAGRTASLWIAVLAVACSSLTFPNRDPTIQGDIVGVGSEIPFGSDRSIWVKETPVAPCGIVFGVTESTEIGETAPDGSIVERTFDDLTVGGTVRVWAAGGIVAESCPGQARAGVIELVPSS